MACQFESPFKSFNSILYSSCDSQIGRNGNLNSFKAIKKKFISKQNVNKGCFVFPWLIETISILWWFEDLACDWSENNEHSRHIFFFWIYWLTTLTDTLQQSIPVIILRKCRNIYTNSDYNIINTTNRTGQNTWTLIHDICKQLISCSWQLI